MQFHINKKTLKFAIHKVHPNQISKFIHCLSFYAHELYIRRETVFKLSKKSADSQEHQEHQDDPKWSQKGNKMQQECCQIVKN